MPAVTFPLLSARLAVRPFTDADAEAAHAVYGDAEVMRHVAYGTPTTRAGTAAMVTDYVRHQREHGFACWAVLDRVSGALVGDAGFEARDDGAEFGYTLARAYWGRGLATEVGHLCVATAFGALGLPWLSAVVDRANPASARVLDKLGFRFTGGITAYGRPHHAYRLTPPPR